MFGFMMIGSIALFCCLPIPAGIRNIVFSNSRNKPFILMNPGNYHILYNS